MPDALYKLDLGDTKRFAVGPAGAAQKDLLDESFSLDHFLAAGGDLAAALAGAARRGPVPPGARLVAPIDNQLVWAAGVTYERSRDARTEESKGSDFYERVYDAERPELFMKALGPSVQGSGETIAIRADSRWNVPEPELVLVADAAGRLVAISLGDDVSSRSIEGENPLYLPQAKVYDQSCSLGPCLVPVDGEAGLDAIVISLAIERDSTLVYEDEIPVSRMHRQPLELLAWLYHSLSFPVGSMLLTGTSMVPPSDFTLHKGDEVVIRAGEIGILTNTVIELAARLAPTR